ncbi:MAG: DoxX family protein [Deltaproteobacteria bacterium]|nr:DoxX family protein [Deltaproteobacteria bacterium]
MPRATTSRRDLGLLVLGRGIGGMFVAHGLPKLTGGPARWHALGENMRHLGVDFAPSVWGLAAALAEGLGGLCLAAGVAFRPAAAALTSTMIVAATSHLAKGDPFVKTSHSVEAGILFASLVLIGPGELRLRRRSGPRGD